jgi:hypothetical protein
MLRILISISILRLVLFQQINSVVTLDSCNIYCSALKEYILANDQINDADTIIVLNKSNILFPNKLLNHTIISVCDDFEIINQFDKNIALELFPKKWEFLFTKVRILKFFVQDDRITIYGSADLLFRKKLFSGRYKFIKMKSYAL